MSDRTPPRDVPSERRWVLALLVAACVGLHIAWVYQSVPLQSANDRSRWSTIRALVEDDSYIIDRFQVSRDRSWATIDLAQKEGHLYSTKPPLLPTLLAWLVEGLTAATGWTLATRTLDLTRTVLLLVNVVPLAIALAMLAGVLRRTTETLFAPAVGVLAVGAATMHTPFVATLNNHTIGLWSAALTLATLHSYDRGSRVWTKRLNAAAAGFFAMWTCCNELPAALFGLTCFGWLAWRDWRRAVFWFGPAAVVPLAGFFWANYEAVGTWRPLYMAYGTETYEFYLNGRPSYWMNPQGIDRNVDEPPVYLMHCLVGHHGVFSLTPLLLLAIPAAFLRSASRWLRFWTRAGAVLSVAVLAFFLTRTENYNYGGVSVALRWLLWLTPLWGMMITATLERWRFGWLKGVAVVLLAASLFSALEPGPNPWQHNWLFRGLTQAGLIAY